MSRFSGLNRTFYRVAALLLAFHFFNYSIDAPDAHPDFIAEDLEHNDIESITEFLAEIVLGWEDAFVEHEERDDESGVSIDFCHFYFTNQGLAIGQAFRSAIATEYVSMDARFILSLSRDVVAPPPRA